MKKSQTHPSQKVTTDPPAGSASWMRCLVCLVVAWILATLVAFLGNYHDGNIMNYDTAAHVYIMPLVVGVMFTLTVILGVLTLSRLLSVRDIGLVFALVIVATPLSRHVAGGWVGTIGYLRALMDRRHPGVRHVEASGLADALPPWAILDLEASQAFDAPQYSLEPNQWVNFFQVPWELWVTPWVYWAPLVLLVLGMGISLGLVVYRQWTEHELVSFPLAQCFSSFITREDGQRWPAIFYRPGFWIGFGLMVFVAGVNGLGTHFEKMIQIPVNFSYYHLVDTFPFLRDSYEGYSLLRGWFYFTMIAIAILIPLEISFTAWAIWPVMILATYIFYMQTGLRYSGTENTALLTGAWFAMALLLIWYGRIYYMALLRAAVGIPARGADRPGVWAMRGLLLCCIALVAVMTGYGLPLDLAIFWVLSLLLMLLVLSRLVAEMGIIWTPLGFLTPTNLLMTLLGPAMGPKFIALLAWMGQILTYQTATLLPVTPAVLLAADVDKRAGGSSGRLALLAAPMVLLALAAMIALLIWIGYSHDRTQALPNFQDLNNPALRINQHFPEQAAAGAWADPGGGGLWQRWANMQPPSRFITFFIAGFVLVTVTGHLRLHLPRFPLHPLPMVLLGTWLLSRYWWAFLFGWFIKRMLMKVGGVQLVDKVRPLCYGVIAGQAVMMTLWVIVNIILFVVNEQHFPFDNGVFLLRFY